MATAFTRPLDFPRRSTPLPIWRFCGPIFTKIAPIRSCGNGKARDNVFCYREGDGVLHTMRGSGWRCRPLLREVRSAPGFSRSRVVDTEDPGIPQGRRFAQGCAALLYPGDWL